MGQRSQSAVMASAKSVALWRWFLLALVMAAMGTAGCAKLLGGPYDKVLVVDRGTVDGGEIVGGSVASCMSRAAECGEFFDEALGVNFQCGGCASNERCVTNQCVCDTVSCTEVGAECGYQNNGCSQLTNCGRCELLYPGDPTKAFCDAAGKCGTAPVLPTTCDELRDLGQPADCGTVGVGETTLDCGLCPGREQCVNNICEGYEPLTCDDLTGGGLLCGTFPNGAGGEITCACGPNERCASSNVCCAPRTDCPMDACGVMPDGCGGTIDCGGCGDSETCLNNVCCGGTPQCPVGVCGPQVVVCGQLLDCSCGAGQCCVGDEDGTGVCHVPACPTDGRCGDALEDGCGGTVDGCECPADYLCNAQSTCECVPRACPADGTCGSLDDGCGGEIDCFVCPDEHLCYEGTCCHLQCPADGSCGLVSNGCGGQKMCGCAEGEACVDGKCATPECPAGADCGVNVVAGVALSCRGACASGETCAERADDIYACGDCSATCPTDSECGLVDLGCTILSCQGSCALDSQSCVNQKAGSGPDNFMCCTPSCPNVNEATCGANVDPSCGGQVADCPGSCLNGERCVLGDEGNYECVVPECPTNPKCGENAAVPEGTIQCDGYCLNDNEQCTRNGGTYACICQAIANPCGASCGTSASNGCGTQVQCSCPATEECVDGSCCQPESDRAVCENANAECGSVVDPECGTEVACGLCAADQSCSDNQCICDPTKCDANESCDAATQTCKCDSTKCPAGQSCTNQGACTCDSSKCPSGKVCNSQGMCACPQTVSQACAGAVCGTALNDCGETVNCGNCGANRTCDDGECVCSESVAEACDGLACGTTTNNCTEQVSCPNTCETVTEQCSGNQCACKETATQACQRLAFECGPATNNCGGAVTCPNLCGQYEQCVGNGCVCDETPAEACARQNLCGAVTGLLKQDRCGGALLDCGACEPGDECVNNLCVCEETPAEACERQNLCGNVSGQGETDVCGQVLTDCGTCGANESCQNNQCVCVETACNGRVCGNVTSLCTGLSLSCGPCTGGTCSPDGSACVPDEVEDVDGGL